MPEPHALGELERYGPVRILIDGEPVCGGTLITNSWVLTADRCVPAEVDSSRLSVGFGASSEHFQQLQGVVELHRFPGNTGDVRVRDLALIGSDAPFELNGSSTNHNLPMLPLTGTYLLQSYRCLAWDLLPDPTSRIDRLKMEVIAPIAVATHGQEDVVWWLNSNLLEPSNGTLLTAGDAGSGCFVQNSESIFLVAVHSENPEFRRNGQPNLDEEAYSSSTTAPAIRDWLDQVLFRALPEVDLELAGAPSACSARSDAIDLFARTQDGGMGWYRRSALSRTEWQSSSVRWVAQPALAPPSSVDLAGDRPGVLCFPDGHVELIARGVDGSLWQQRWVPAENAWEPKWKRVFDAADPVTSGVSLVGAVPTDFHVFVLGADSELRHARYNRGWTGLWEDLGGVLFGAPAARMGNPEWTDVFVQGVNHSLWNNYARGTPRQWSQVGEAWSAPAVTTWSADRIDIFTRTASSTLGHYWYELFWLGAPIDTRLTLPEGDLAAAFRERGSLDVFVSGSSGFLWHAIWPREPEPGVGD